MSLIFQEIVLMLLIIALAVFSAFSTRQWYIDKNVINIKVIKPDTHKKNGDAPKIIQQ